ncbi:class I SAM-dependent methyltransferase [Novosphingobium sp.]|uniref:class I SAM-dependent methyltransferase n=1 Tax=Novosphingobium sp. TaxID=1874826 RepID=UPI00333F0DBE
MNTPHVPAPAGLLIHSMAEFQDLILTVLELAGARNVAEIGAEYGAMTQPLADHCHARGGSLIAIDPSPAPGFVDWAAAHAHVQHIARPSLEVIGTLSAIDAWLIDGDHNYYTVFNELVAADAVARRDGQPLLAALHDVGWPCSRRDMYYAPDRIPAEFLQPCHPDAGVTLGNPGFLMGRGFRGAGQFAWALQAGGPRNGVLTAIEDFCRQTEADGRRLLYAHVPAVFGLGLLFDADAPWANAVADAVMPYHDNPLLAKLERNRLRNYLTVLDWQDGFLQR